ncbi:MAG TPA: phospholipase D-like domain-containing protein [Povalibacter sp.]|nr:phospholipase D-like domain-containing protein [Povalibacter sp.]
MRFKSRKTAGYQVFAVTGVNTVSFAIDAQQASTRGLLGFAVERIDRIEKQRYYMAGFKVFRSVIPQPAPQLSVSTFNHPVQSFVWDDFTGKPDRPYEYLFHPLKGTARRLDRSAAPIHIKVRTEPLFTRGRHDVFFNRGVASSQAYERKFGNKPPDRQPTEEKKVEAAQWLSRDLDEALLEFVRRARKGDTLLGCFYEFRYLPMALELRAAQTRGVTVRLILDAKQNADSFPRDDNLDMLRQAQIPRSAVTLREARKASIQHNKFMVLLKGKDARPSAVWTGSTNLSVGGIHGQANVGHWVRSAAVAKIFRDYWNLLQTDPGGASGDDPATVRSKNAALRTRVETLTPVPGSKAQIVAGITPVLSPRRGDKAMNLYGELLDTARQQACVTLAFGVNREFKELLKDNSDQSHISFLLLEKKDQPAANSAQPFIEINRSNNVYMAWGSFLRTPLHQWAKETSARGLGLNTHVSFIHSKFLLVDPLSDDPIVVTGSANFSAASENENDENMLIIRGHRRVADIYYTEFNRLFNHYYFRSVIESLQQEQAGSDAGDAMQSSIFLDETDGWLKKYKRGTFRWKRVRVAAAMRGFRREKQVP